MEQTILNIKIEKYNIFEKVPVHGYTENNMILGPYSCKEDAEKASAFSANIYFL